MSEQFRLDPKEVAPLLGGRHRGQPGDPERSRLAGRAGERERAPLPDFDVRTPLAGATLLQLWAWDEKEFLRRTEGSPIRRIGHLRWQRNLAVALGNALRAAPDSAIRTALQQRQAGAAPLLREHIDWALAQRAVSEPG